jgi:hypothetical protein
MNIFVVLGALKTITRFLRLLTLTGLSGFVPAGSFLVEGLTFTIPDLETTSTENTSWRMTK